MPNDPRGNSETQERAEWLEYPPLRNTWRNAAWWLLAWVPALIGLIAWVIVCLNPEPHVFWLTALPLSILSCFVLAIILHELGHYFAALLLGLEPLIITIGHGPALLLARFQNGLGLSVRALPTSGFVLVWPRGMHLLRVRWLFMVLAGPVVNICLLLGAIAVLNYAPDWKAFIPGHPRAARIVSETLFVNAVITVCSLLPYRLANLPEPWPNDGWQAVKLLFDRSFRPWPDHFTTEINRGPVSIAHQPEIEESRHWSADWRNTIQRQDPHLVLESYQRLLSEPGISREVRLELLDTFATGVLMYNAREYLTKADEYSKELYEANPDEWSVRGTRGSILVETGRIEEGIEMLGTVVENDPLPFDRAIAATYVAIGEISRGKPEAAKAWIEQARSFDPNCVPLQRAVQMLKRLSADSNRC